MSWGLQYASLADFFDSKSAHPLYEPTRETLDQVNAAHEAVRNLVASGAIGGAGKDYAIYLSGHSNPNHEKTPGWANDCVSVSVTQKDPPPEVPEHEPATREEVRADG